MKKIFVFTYGTLMKGERNHDNFLKDAKFIKEHTIKGQLMDLGSFPALLEGDNDVIGEIFQINKNILASLDCLEGYRPEEEETSFYLRKSFHLNIDGKMQTVFYYQWNNKLSINYTIVESGVKWGEKYDDDDYDEE